MTFRIFPTSPLPAPLGREIDWKNSGEEYDTGLGQNTTALSKPLYIFSFTQRNMPASTHNSLETFYNTGKGRNDAFWMKDPYDQHDLANSRIFVQTGTAPTSVFWRNHNSYHYWPDSATFSGWLTSDLLGVLVFNTDYVLDQETGIMVFSTAITSLDFLTVTGTVSYFKKLVFDSKFQAATPKVWNSFNVKVNMRERTR